MSNATVPARADDTVPSLIVCQHCAQAMAYLVQIQQALDRASGTLALLILAAAANDPDDE